MLAKRRLLTWCDDGGTNGSVPTGRTRVLVEESRWAGCSARLQRAIQGNRSSLVAKERPITATAVIGGLPARSLSGRSRRTAVSAYTQGNAPWSGSKCVQAGTGSAPIRRPLDSTTSRKCGVGHAEQAFRCLFCEAASRTISHITWRHSIAPDPSRPVKWIETARLP